MVALLAGVLIWFFWPAKPNLAGFNPNRLGELEAAMWRDYYQQSWCFLAVHAWQAAHRQYGFSRWDSLRLAWHAGRAARAFQRNAADESAVAEMTYYYWMVSQRVASKFAPDEAARLEVHWWRQRRAGAPPNEWSQTIAALTALVYGCSAETCSPAAQARVAAMVYRDAHRKTGLNEAEWHEVSRQLVCAYTLLLQSVAASIRNASREHLQEVRL